MRGIIFNCLQMVCLFVVRINYQYLDEMRNVQSESNYILKHLAINQEMKKKEQQQTNGVETNLIIVPFSVRSTHFFGTPTALSKCQEYILPLKIM